MTDKSRKKLNLRIFFIFVVFFISILAISARAYQLQILEREKLSELANKQYKRIIPHMPKRGIIYDRNKEEMAISVDVDSIYAEPPKVTNVHRYARKLSKILKVNRRNLVKKLKSKRSFVWVKRRVTPDQSRKVKALKLDGIHFIKEAKRFFPNREMAGHSIGFVGLDPKGLEGLELEYDHYLKGEAASSVAEMDALGRIIFTYGLGQRDCLIGNDLVLTIDKTIQYIAEQELQNAITKTNAKSGIVIVMDPKNGEILALANHPRFNPNVFWKYSPSSWRNRAITDSFEPGSTFKVFLLAGALEEGVVSKRDIFFCENGSYSIGRKTIHDVHSHAWLSLKNIIKVSSNIGMGKLGVKVGKETLYEYIKKFGFGEKTGISLPGETPGLVRLPRKWSQIAVHTISFGQGLSVSALQLITGLSAIANKGYLMKPHIVKQIVTHDGNIIKEFQPQIVRRVISEKTAKEVTSILKNTVLEGGTGTEARLNGYCVAGKTGTAQKADLSSGGYHKDRFIASFMGFVPADDPEVSILVVIDEPKGKHFGGQVAGPVFKKIAEKTLHYRGVLPNRAVSRSIIHSSRSIVKTSYNKKSTIKRKEKAKSEKFIMPDLTGMSIRQVLRIMQEAKIDIRIVGSGRVVKQSLRPGIRPKAGQKCWVTFRQSS